MGFPVADGEQKTQSAVKQVVRYAAMTQPTLAGPAQIYSEVSMVWESWGGWLDVTAPMHPQMSFR